MDNFVYDAPDFFDFSRDLDGEDPNIAEAFFEMEHKNHNGMQGENVALIEDSERDLEQEFYTPLKKTPGPTKAAQCLRNHLRKSLSMNNLPTDNSTGSSMEINTISEAMEHLEMSENKKSSKIFAHAPSTKSHGMTTRSSAPKLNLRSRSISKDHLDQLAQPKRKNVSHEDLQAQKYVSMAEAINQFQQKTPVRFHTKSKADPMPVAKMYGPIPNTIPQSPALATKQRARTTHVMTREEQELKEYEEHQKYKIKANPVNPRILNGPVQPKQPVAKKPATQPEPFKLTEVPVKKAPTSPKPAFFEFHAKPIPKSVLQPPKPIIKSLLYTHPQTPNLMKRHHRVEPAKIEPPTANGPIKAVQQPFKLNRTKPVPFSFEQRDKDVIKKREQLVNEVFEEEKKAREFHARPLPKNIFRSPQLKITTFCYQKRQKSDNSLLYKSTENLAELSTFKARPAKVLQMKPFEPKKNDHHIEISEFQLSTERRAKEREEYDRKMKQKEEKFAQLLKERDEKLLRQEQEETAKLRKELEYKAQPVRHYKEVQPVPSKKLTAPISPKFLSGKIKNKADLINNKENSMNNSNFNEL